MYAANNSSSDTSKSVPSLTRRITSVVTTALPFMRRATVESSKPMLDANALRERFLPLSQTRNGFVMSSACACGAQFCQSQNCARDAEAWMFAFDYNACMAEHYIRAWRKKRGLTLQALCDRMESEPGEPLISYSQLTRIERSISPYTQKTLEAIAIALDVTPAMLLEDDPDKEGEVVDLIRRLEQAAPEKRTTILTMLRAAVGD
ncbi:MAG: helix-turn-helix transcriptional regulator [Pseudomonadota bacterium]